MAIIYGIDRALFFYWPEAKGPEFRFFTLSAIHNFLAEIYLRDSSIIELKPVLGRAYREIQTYAIGLEYNFWKHLPPVKSHKRFGSLDKAPLVRRPTNFKTKSRLVMKMSNVTNDADDTNQANLANYNHNLIFGDSLEIAKPQVFENWIDKNRQNRNWYNYPFHTKKNLAAYLTWLKQSINTAFGHQFIRFSVF